MKLLLENWREYLKLESFEGGIDPDQAKAIEETGLILNRYLGEGSYGKVYEIENKETGQRFAAKVVSNIASGGKGFHEEEKNYNWILQNRDKLPDEIKKHLVEVYEIIKTKDKQHLIIIMEQLEEPPRNVIDQIFAHDSKSEYSVEKEERILKDPEAVYEIVLDILDTDKILKNLRDYRGLSNTQKTAAANNIMQSFTSNHDVPKNSTLHVYEMISVYSKASPRWQRLYNAILNEVTHLLHQAAENDGYLIRKLSNPPDQDKERTLRAFIWASAESIEVDLEYAIKRHVVPMKFGAGPFDYQRSAGEAITAVFPETEGILNTIEHFAKMGWRARDLHAGNIMMRANTNELVITDVGLFVVER